MCPVGMTNSLIAVLWEEYGKKILGFLALLGFTALIWIVTIKAMLGMF